MTPTKCSLCKDLLTGLSNQGLQCESCKMNIHKRCQGRAERLVECCEKLERITLSKHEFKQKTFTKPTHCIVCKNLLIGIVNQGFWCNDCRSAAHKRCLTKVEGICGEKSELILMEGEDESSSLLNHQFKVFTYSVPTDCIACGELLVGVYKQGLQCSFCKVNIHKGCIELANTKLTCSASRSPSPSSKRNPILEPQLPHVPDYGHPPPPPSPPLQDKLAKAANEVVLGLKMMQRESEVAMEKAIIQSGEYIQEKFGDDIHKLEDELNQFESSLEQHFVATNDSVQRTFEKMEQDGFANTLSRGIKNTGESIKRGLSAMVDSVEGKPKGEKVELDPELVEGSETVSRATAAVASGASEFAASLKAATVYTAEQFSGSELQKSLNDNVDRDFAHASMEVLSGVGQVWEASTTTIYDVLGSAGDASTRVAHHQYGEDVGRVTASSAHVLTDSYRTMSTASGTLSGSIFLSSVVKSTPNWKLAHKTVMGQCMYTSVFEFLEFKANLVTVQADVARKLKDL